VGRTIARKPRIFSLTLSPRARGPDPARCPRDRTKSPRSGNPGSRSWLPKKISCCPCIGLGRRSY
jgi:hypothetical protein